MAAGDRLWKLCTASVFYVMGIHSRSETLRKPFLLAPPGIRLASINHRDPPCQRLSGGLCSVDKCLLLAQGWWYRMGGTWGRMGQGEQRGLIPTVHNWNSWSCYWTPAIHGRSPVTPGSCASATVCDFNTKLHSSLLTLEIHTT